MKTVKNNNRTVNNSLTPKQHVTQFRQMLRKDKQLTITEYRAAYGIPDATFYNWRRKYAPSLIAR